MNDTRLAELAACIEDAPEQLRKLGEFFLIRHASWERDYGRVHRTDKQPQEVSNQWRR